MKVKTAHVFQWEDEPVDERPSEFFASSSYPTASGYQSVRAPGPARHSSKGLGFKGVLIFWVLLLGVAAWGLSRLVPLLQH